MQLGTYSPLRRQTAKSAGSATLAPPTSGPEPGAPSSKQETSAEEEDGGESPAEGESRADSIKPKRKLSTASRRSQKSQLIDTTHHAMGSKWPKAMWDNTESKLIQNEK